MAPGASRGLAGERSVVCGRAGGGRRDCFFWGGLARDGGFVACVISQCVHDHALSTVSLRLRLSLADAIVDRTACGLVHAPRHGWACDSASRSNTCRSNNTPIHTAIRHLHTCLARLVWVLCARPLFDPERHAGSNQCLRGGAMPAVPGW